MDTILQSATQTDLSVSMCVRRNSSASASISASPVFPLYVRRYRSTRFPSATAMASYCRRSFLLVFEFPPNCAEGAPPSGRYSTTA